MQKKFKCWKCDKEIKTFWTIKIKLYTKMIDFYSFDGLYCCEKCAVENSKGLIYEGSKPAKITKRDALDIESWSKG